MKNSWILFVVISGLAGSCTAQDTKLNADQARIAVQAICPVSGEKLGAHGPPVKANIGEEVVFLCCKACLKGQVNATHWKTIHTNFAKAQGKCLVMDNKLPKQPEWGIVNGRVIFVCCPPCIEKLETEPEKYVEKLDKAYQDSVTTPPWSGSR